MDGKVVQGAAWHTITAPSLQVGKAEKCRAGRGTTKLSDLGTLQATVLCIQLKTFGSAFQAFFKIQVVSYRLESARGRVGSPRAAAKKVGYAVSAGLCNVCGLGDLCTLLEWGGLSDALCAHNFGQ